MAAYDRADESTAERLDRNWNELLQELRVTQTGIQILSGFLLILPFQSRFYALDDAQRALYLIAVALATTATGFVIAPVTSHRLLFRQRRKDDLVELADRLAQFGLAALGLTIVTVVTLVFSVVTGWTGGILAGLVAVTFFVTIWVMLPLRVGDQTDR